MDFLKDIDVFQILSLGAVGLGFFFGIFAFRLLSNEQKIQEPRPKIIHAIYVFMLFSIVLVMLGVWGKISDRAPILAESGTNDKALDELFEKTKKDLGLDYEVDQFKNGEASITRASDTLTIHLKPNECRLALAMASPPQRISVTYSEKEVKDGLIKIRKSSGSNYERVEACAGDTAVSISLSFSVITKRRYQFRAESFFINPAPENSPTL
jgi:hypothetical protein